MNRDAALARLRDIPPVELDPAEALARLRALVTALEQAAAHEAEVRPSWKLAWGSAVVDELCAWLDELDDLREALRGRGVAAVRAGPRALAALRHEAEEAAESRRLRAAHRETHLVMLQALQTIHRCVEHAVVIQRAERVLAREMMP